MAKKINVKLILELRAAHMSRNGIAASRHISKNSVGDVFHIAWSINFTTKWLWCQEGGVGFKDTALERRMRNIGEGC